jgi:hypothetical protein
MAPGLPGKKAGPGMIPVPLQAFVRAIYVNAYRRAATLRTGVPSTWGEERIPCWDGGYDGQNNHKPVWPKIAQFCLDHQVDPVEFIAAQFDNPDPGRELPTPNRLYRDAALGRYRQRVRAGANDLALALYLQRQHFESAVALVVEIDDLPEPGAIAEVLRDSKAQLSGLFRHGMAALVGLTAIAGQFHDAALLQYVFRRDAYDHAWGPLIPRRLREEATALVGSWESPR